MKVKLLKPHTHGGNEYPAGAEVDLPDADVEWLKANGEGTIADAPAASRSATRAAE